MTRTWHGSCNACSCTTSPHQSQKFARPLPRGLDAIGGRRSPLLPASAATFIRYDQPQMGTDTALGRRFGVCRLALAVGRTGRLTTGGLGCSSLNWPGLRSRRSLNRNGIGRRANVPFAINTYAADNSSKHYVKPLKRHFQNSDCYDPKRSNSGGQTLGYRGQDYERHHG